MKMHQSKTEKIIPFYEIPIGEVCKDPATGLYIMRVDRSSTTDGFNAVCLTTGYIMCIESTSKVIPVEAEFSIT